MALSNSEQEKWQGSVFHYVKYVAMAFITFEPVIICFFCVCEKAYKQGKNLNNGESLKVKLLITVLTGIISKKKLKRTKNSTKLLYVQLYMFLILV